MNQGIRQVIRIGLLSVVFAAHVASAQQKSSNTSQKSAKTEAAKPVEEPLEAELAGETADKAQDSTPKKTETKKSDSAFYGQDSKYALKGYSFGAVAFNQSFGSSVALNLDGTSKRISAKSPDFQFAGGMVSYSEYPYNSIGTNLSLLLGVSLNHNNVGYKPILAAKFEVNLGYAWQTLSRSSIFAFGGLGYESLSGKEFNYFASPGGNFLQAGIGMNYSKTITLEGIIAISRHSLGSTYPDTVISQAKSQGFTNVELDYDGSVITSTTLMGRLQYHY